MGILVLILRLVGRLLLSKIKSLISTLIKLFSRMLKMFEFDFFKMFKNKIANSIMKKSKNIFHNFNLEPKDILKKFFDNSNLEKIFNSKELKMIKDNKDLAKKLKDAINEAIKDIAKQTSKYTSKQKDSIVKHLTDTLDKSSKTEKDNFKKVRKENQSKDADNIDIDFNKHWIDYGTWYASDGVGKVGYLTLKLMKPSKRNPLARYTWRNIPKRIATMLKFTPTGTTFWNVFYHANRKNLVHLQKESIYWFGASRKFFEGVK